jgi:serine/threonine protein kinase/Flp pilus assembly protein TadD
MSDSSRDHSGGVELPPLPTGSTPQDWLATVKQDLLERWQRGERVLVEDYLEHLPELSRNPEQLLDLIYAEILRREERGEEPTLEEYTARFPALRRQLDMQFSVHRALKADSVLGKSVTPLDESDGQATGSYRPAARLGQPPLEELGSTRTTVAPAAGNTGHDPYQTVAPGSPSATDEGSQTASFRAPPQRAQDHDWPEDSPNSGAPTVPGYEILGVLGKGGMGIVYKARQKGLKRLVALKMIRDASMAGADDLARFQIEAQALATLQHPHIVQVFEVGQIDKMPYFSLEFVDGGNLGKKLARSPQPAQWSAEMMETLALAMHAAHEKNIIHRDLKPANVLLTADGTPKITDFGLAKQLDSEEMSQTHAGAVMGTPNYMAPEQAAGEIKNIGPLSDVYALGVILYEMLTGRLPLVGETLFETLLLVKTVDPLPPRQLLPKVPLDLDTICMKCLQKDSARRYASAGALADDLRRWLNHEPIQARPVSLWEKAKKWVRRKPGWAAAIVLGAVAVLSLIGGLSFAYDAANTRAQVAEAKNRALERRGDVRDGLRPKALAAMTERDWNKAIQALTEAIAKISDDEEAEDLRIQLAADLREAQTGADYRKRRLNAIDQSNEAYFWDMQVGSGEKHALEQTHKFTLAALGQFGIDERWTRVVPDIPPQYFSEAERQEMQILCRDLVIVWARTEASPLLNADVKPRAARALAVLDRLVKEVPPTQGLHHVRADLLDRLERRADAMKAREEAPEEPVDAADYFRAGEKLFREGNLVRAAEDYQEALRRREGNYYWAQYRLAWCQLQMVVKERGGNALPQLGAAVSHLNTSVNRRPTFPWSYLMRGYARTELGWLEEQQVHPTRAKSHFAAAEADFKLAEDLITKEGKEDKEAWYGLYTNRGTLRIRQGKPGDAVAELQKARQEQPQQVQAYVLLAEAFREQGELDNALAMIGEAIKLQPGQGYLQRTRALLLLRKDRPDAGEVLKAYAQAIDLTRKARGDNSTSLANLHLERGDLYRRLLRFKEAVQDYDAVIELRRDLVWAYFTRSEAQYELAEREADLDRKLKDYEQAAHSADEYFRREPKPRANDYAFRARLRSRLALALSASKDEKEQGRALDLYQGAIEDYSRLIDLKPEPANWSRRGWETLLIMDAPKLALPDFKRVVEREPNNMEAYVGRGLCLAQLGSWRAAVTDAEKAEELLRKNKEKKETAFTVFNLARTYGFAVARIDELPRAPGVNDTRVQYQGKALETLERALQNLPAEQRVGFWHSSVRSDKAFSALRASAGYRQLRDQYEKPAKK